MQNSYILVRKDGELPSGGKISAQEAIENMISNKMWPLFRRTPHRRSIKADDRVVFYASKKGIFLGEAIVTSISPWRSSYKEGIKFLLDGVPEDVIFFDKIRVYDDPVEIRSLLDRLCFIPANKKAWGMAMVGGVRKISEDDYKEISSSARQGKG